MVVTIRQAGLMVALAAATLLAAGPALAQCPDGTPPPCGGAAAPARPSPRSIAVLPFANRSPDSADVYLAEGMTDEVGSHLTQVSRLQVKARGVVAAAWQRNPDPLGAARALRVAWYVHGTVRHVPPQLLVSIELVRPATGEEVWAKRFARSDADVFAAQAEVAESVAVVVGGRLSPGERTVLARRPTRDNEAYRLYLFGNALLSRRTQRDVRRAVDAYTEAVRLDPRFAAAWARLGMARTIQYSWSWRESLPRDSLLAIAFAAAQHAVTLDSMSSEAWLALGAASSNAGDLGNAATSYGRSLGLDSLNPEALHFAGIGYAVDGDYCLDIPEAAAPLLRRALALDPVFETRGGTSLWSPAMRDGWRRLKLCSTRRWPSDRGWPSTTGPTYGSCAGMRSVPLRTLPRESARTVCRLLRTSARCTPYYGATVLRHGPCWLACACRRTAARRYSRRWRASKSRWGITPRRCPRWSGCARA